MWVILGGIALVALGLAIVLARWAWTHPNQSPFIRILAYAGSGCMLLAMVGCPAVMLPVFMSAREAAKRTACLENIRQVGKAMQMYLSENDGVLPHANWCDSLADYLEPEYLACPDHEGSYGYSMNSAALGMIAETVPDPATFVLAFDGGGSGNALAGIEGVDWDRHMRAASLVFLDGHARLESRESASEFTWTPQVP